MSAQNVNQTDLSMSDGRFVIHRHEARTLHYDMRLEKDGVFKSWAVPKGIPQERGIRRLAIRTDDHDLDFGEFEGKIPKGEYGAGTIEVWDAGTYELHEWSDERIVFTLNGRKVSGTFNLVRFHRGGEREWLLFRRSQNPNDQ